MGATPASIGVIAPVARLDNRQTPSRAVPNDVPAGVLRWGCDGDVGSSRVGSEPAPNSAVSAVGDN